MGEKSSHGSPLKIEDRAPAVEPLTPREHEVLRLMTNGCGNREIAEALTLSPNSVKWYIHQIFAKLDVDSRPAAIQAARELGLADAGLRAAAYSHNLPAALMPFIGRQADLRRICDFLADPAYRLLTLIGAGGIGKTRLALQAASELRGRYPHGAWLVELASLSDPELVSQSVAAVFALPHGGERPAHVALVDFLREKKLLLVLDNCEHLVEACARLANTLLRASPGLHILATSREALGLEAERTYLVPPLSCPAAGPTAPPEDLLQFEAVDLFTQRAQLVLPDFELGDENAGAVAQLTRHLDGIPLALELAAARLKVMDLDQVAAQLEDRFHLLSGGDRAAPPRLQTMRASIDWSYQLLPEAEKSLFRRLSVFAGGCDLEAAQAVCADATPSEASLLDRLEGLLNKSLVQPVRNKGQAVRYHLLETIRQYAFGKLTDAGETATIRTRQLDYWVDLATRAEPELVGPDQVAWFDRLEAELDNIRAALEWSLETGGREAAGLSVASKLRRFWLSRGHADEGQNWLKRTLEASRDPADRPAWALALVQAAELAWRDDARAIAHARAAGLDWNDPAPDSAIAAAAWLIWNDPARVDETLRLVRGLGPAAEECIALALFDKGEWAYGEADFVRAAALYREALEKYRELGSRASVCETLTTLGMTLCRQAKYQEAVPLLKESLELARQAGDTNEIAYAIWQLGVTATEAKDVEQARRYYGQALALYRQLKDRTGVACMMIDMGLLALQTGDVRQAETCYRELLSYSWDLGDNRALSHCLQHYAHFAAVKGQAELAARLLGAAEALWEASDKPIISYRPPEYEACLELVRAQLEPGVLAARWAEGRAMTARQAVAEAMAGGQQ